MSYSSTLHPLFQAGAHAKVIEIANQLNISSITDPESSRIVAASLFVTGDFAAASARLEDVYSSYCEDPHFLSLYGATLRRLGDFHKAEKLFLKALNINSDSKEINNNYANLLIDLDRLDEARDILSTLVSKHPGYEDALVNLSRVDALSTSKSSSKANPAGNIDLSNPLLLAFSDGEVEYSSKRYGLANKNSTHADSLLPAEDSSVIREQLSLAAKALEVNDYDLTLKLCSELLSKIGVTPSIYELASDAYLNLDQFFIAEISLLHSILNGGNSLKHYVNLVSFACMRKDYKLAKIYLSKAESLDPSSAHLQSLRSQISDQDSSASPFSFASVSEKV